MENKRETNSALPRVIFIDNGDLSGLNEKQLEQLEKLEQLERIKLNSKARTDDILEKMHSRCPLPKPVKAVAPVPPPMKKLSADEILALHKKDFTEKRFKPSFISVSALEDGDTAAAPPIDEYEKLARLYYSSEPDGLNPTD